MSNIRVQAIELFKGVLSDAGCTFDEDGTIRTHENVSGGVKHPKLKIDNLPVVLPYQDQLDKPEGTSLIFAPLHENVLAGESAMIAALKQIINRNLSLRAKVLLTTVAVLCVNEVPVTPALRGVLNRNPNVNKTTVAALKKLLSRAGNTATRSVLGVYLTSKDVKYKGRKVKRLATVSSSLRRDLELGKTWDVTMGKSTRESIINLIDTVLPGLNEDAYTFGSNDDTAPRFAALVTAYYNISNRLVELEEDAYEALGADAAEICAVLPPLPKHEWIDQISNLYMLGKAFPALAGNLGNEIVGKEGVTVEGGVNTDRIHANDAKPGTEQSSKEDTPPWDGNPSQQGTAKAPEPAAPQQGSSWGAPSQAAMRDLYPGQAATPNNASWGAPQQSGWGAPPAQGGGWGAPPQSGNSWGATPPTNPGAYPQADKWK